MAEFVHLFLTTKGKPVPGEPSQESLGRMDTIECIFFAHNMHAPREPHTAQPTGRRQHAPILVRKRLDASSPLLARALLKNQRVDGEFRFYRAADKGDGTTEHFYTIGIEDACIESISQTSEGALDVLSPHPPMEEVTFVFPKIWWVYEPRGIMHVDSWDEG